MLDMMKLIIMDNKINVNQLLKKIKLKKVGVWSFSSISIFKRQFTNFYIILFIWMLLFRLFLKYPEIYIFSSWFSFVRLKINIIHINKYLERNLIDMKSIK